MPRSVWKGPFVDGYLLKKAEATRAEGRHKPIKTWSRRSTVMPSFVGLTFQVHNGQKFIPVLVDEDMVGHKLGSLRQRGHIMVIWPIKKPNGSRRHGQAKKSSSRRRQ